MATIIQTTGAETVIVRKRAFIGMPYRYRASLTCRLSLGHASRELVGEDVAAHLAHEGLRDLVDDLDALGPQALGHALAFQVGRDRLQGRHRVAQRRHEGADALAQAVVGHADGGRLAHARAAHQVVVDLAGRQVLAAADDDLLAPAVDADAAVLVHVAQVAREPPAVVGERAVGALRLVQVADELVRATGDVLALDARGHIVSLLVDVAHLDAREGDAGPVAVPFHAFARGHEHVRAALRGAEDLAEQDVVVVGAVDERPGHRRAAAGVQHVGGQRLVRVGVQVLHDVVDERRGAHGPGGALGVDEVDGVLHGEVLHEHGSAAQKHRRHETVEEAHGVVQAAPAST